MKRHKRLIYNGLIFAISSLAIYGLFICTLSRCRLNETPIVYRFVNGLVWKGGHTLPRFRDFNPENNYDVLVFGSSTANRSVDPSVFATCGINVYNLGTDDQTPLNTEVLVNHYIAAAKPRLVILDIYDRVFCQSPYESAADFIQNGNSHSAALKMALQLGDIRAVNMLAVRMATYDLPSIQGANDSLNNGFRAVKHRISKFTPDNYRYKSDKIQLAAFERTIRHLNDRKIPVVLTIQPKPVYYMEENHEKFMRDIQPIIEKYNLHVVELSMKDAGLAMDDYADMSHLNKQGAKKYSEALLENIFESRMIARN